MSSAFGKNIKISLFGESHGDAIGMVIDSLPAGIRIDMDSINAELSRRRPNGLTSTARIEPDNVEFLSGVKDGYSEGSPICFIIRNENKRSSDYIEGNVRPSHADLTANIKYSGFNDYRGGGHFSGRITAPIVVLGAICKDMLKKKNIKIRSHVSNIGDIEDERFDFERFDVQIDKLEKTKGYTIDEEKSVLMEEKIIECKNNLDSIGGSIETSIIGLDAGIGDPYFDSFESILSHLVFSIGGVKGISFGDVDDFSKVNGSVANDQMEMKDGKISYLSNHSGGINGGITNGQPVIFKTTIKPTPSIAKLQKSVNLKTNESIDLEIKGRHDPCIVLRALPVIEALTAYACVEMMEEDYKSKVFR